MRRLLSLLLVLGLFLGVASRTWAQCGACSGPQKIRVALRVSASFAGKITTKITVGGVLTKTIPITAGSVTYDSASGRYVVGSYGNGEWAETEMIDVTIDDKVSQEICFTSEWETDSTKAAYTVLNPNSPGLYSGLNFPSAGCLSYWLDPGSGEYVRFEMSSLSQPIYNGRNAARLQVKLGDGISTSVAGDSTGPVAGNNGPFPPRADYQDTRPVSSRFGVAAAAMAAAGAPKIPTAQFKSVGTGAATAATPLPDAPSVARAVFRQDPVLVQNRQVVPGPIQQKSLSLAALASRKAVAASAAAATPPVANAAPAPTVAAAPIGALFLPIKLGGDQGRLFYSVAAINSAAYSPTHLSLSSEDRVIQRVTTGGGVLRQLLLLDSFVDIRTTSATAFEVRFYSPTQIGAFNSGTGLFPITDDTPLAIWQIDNPDTLPTANRVRFRETRSGVTRTHLATWTAPVGAQPARMTLSLNDAAIVETRDYTLGTMGDANIRQERVIRRGPGAAGPIASDVIEVWQEFYNWGSPGQVLEGLVQRVEDPDGAALTANHVYYDDVNVPANSLNAVIHPDGYWEVYQRFSTGEVYQTYRPYGDTPASPFSGINASDCRFTQVDYTDYSAALQLRVEATYLLGAPIRRTELWKQLDDGQITETTFRYLDSNRFTESQRVIFSKREAPAFELSETGATLQRLTQLGWWNPTNKSFAQSWSTTLPKAKRTFVVHGSLQHMDGVANFTLIDVTVEDEHGHTLCDEQFVNTDGLVPDPSAWNRTDPISRTVRTYNSRGLLTATERNGLLVYEAGYQRDGKLDWEIDDAGVHTAYFYDVFGRIDHTTRTLAATDPVQTTTFTYDAADRVRFEVVSAAKSGTTRSLTTETRYDSAGRITHTITPAGLTTQTTEEIIVDGSGQPTARRVTVTLPSGATAITEYALDRTIKSIIGTAAAPIYSTRYLAPINGTYFEYVQTYRDAALNDFRDETLTDWLGNMIEFTVPGFQGVGYVSRSSVFDGGPGPDGAVRGLLSTVSEPGRAPALYEYDEFGVQSAAGLDANSDGTLNRDGTDPVTSSNVAFSRANAAAPWFRTAQRSVLLKDSDVTETVIEETREQLTGLAAGVVAQRETLTADGKRTSEKQSVTRSTKTSVVERRDLAATASNAAEIQTSVAGLVRTLRRPGAAADVAYSYDALGRVESVADPLSGTLTYAFNDAGQLETVIDSAATPRITRYTYQPNGVPGAGQKSTITDAAGFVTRMDYTLAGQLYRQWGRNVTPIHRAFDAEGRLTELRTFRSQDTQTGGTVDWSQTTWPTNAPAGDLTQWVYDPPSGLLAFKRYADFNAADTQPIQQSFTYDGALRLRTRTNARGQSATSGYDSLGRLQTITYSAGSGTPDVTLGHDRAGRLTSATDGVGSRTLTLTAFGQPDDDTYTAGQLSGLTVNRSFDANRRLGGVTVTGAVGLTFGYDTYSRLETVTDSSSSTAHSFTYGYSAGTTRVETLEARRAGMLRLTTKRTFDGLGRLTGTEARNAANQVLVSHGYSQFDALDRRTVVDREDGKRWNYGYNARGEVTSAQKSFPAGEGGAALAGWASSYLYDSIGNRIASSDFAATLPAVGSPLRSDYEADSLNQYDQRTVPGRLALSGDAAANATVAVTVNDVTIPVTRQGAVGTQKFWEAEWTTANALDAAFGTVRVKATVASYAPAGSVGTLFLPKTPEVFVHDRDGNLTQDGRWNYSWDAENRLIAMETRPELVQIAGGLPVEKRTKLQFGYDFAGRRVQKKVSTWNGSAYVVASDTRFLYDGWNLLAELNGLAGNAVVHSYIWGLDVSGSMQGAGGVGGLLAINTGTATYLPAFDANGNLAAAFDSNTVTEVARFDYDVFGRTLQAVGPSAADLPFRFSTKYTDPETGLLYYGFRYYNPSTGRWPSRDPINENGGLHLYGFVGNATPIAIDKFGLSIRATCSLKAYFDSIGITLSGEESRDAGDYVYSSAQVVRDASAKEVVTAMINGGRVHEFDSVENLKLHVEARLGVVRFTTLKRFGFGAGDGMKMNRSFWMERSRLNSDNKIEVYWDVREGVSVADAILDVYNNPGEYCISCEMATKITMAGGAAYYTKTPITADFKKWEDVERDDVVPGDSGFVEHVDYNGSTMGLEGENIIYVGAGLWWGHFSPENERQPLEDWEKSVANWPNGNGAKFSRVRHSPPQGLRK